MYLQRKKLYNTGYLPNTTDIRQKQGLMSQEVTNDCVDQYALRSPPTCNNQTLYPLTLGFRNYGQAGMIPSDCPCARFVLPP